MRTESDSAAVETRTNPWLGGLLTAWVFGGLVGLIVLVTAYSDDSSAGARVAGVLLTASAVLCCLAWAVCSAFIWEQRQSAERAMPAH